MISCWVFGLHISSKGVQPGPSKLDAIKLFLKPEDINEVKRFYWIGKFLQKICTKFCSNSRTDTKRKTIWMEKKQQEAFDQINKILTAQSIFKLFNPRTGKSELHTLRKMEWKSKNILAIKFTVITDCQALIYLYKFTTKKMVK